MTKNEARSGPSAKPTFPPTEKKDMPVARRLRSRSSRTSSLGMVGGNSHARDEDAEQDEPVARSDRREGHPDAGDGDSGGQEPERSRASDQSPNAGWMSDELIVAARTSAPTIV